MPAEDLQNTPTAAPRIIANHEVLEAMGTSALGKVYHARRLDNDAKVVLQLLSRPGNVEEAAWKQSLQRCREFLTAQQRLDAHPNIQHVLEFGEEENVFYILSAYFTGRTLRQIIESDGPRSLEWLLPVYAQIASAIDFAASVGMSHTDLTPYNIFVSEPENEVHIINFGIGHVRNKLGSPYLAPEQVNGAEGDVLSDIYSMGVILYESLSGRPAFTGTSADDICKKIRGTDPPDLEGQPNYVVQIIRRMMTKSPENRYRVAVDAVTDLKYQRNPPPIRKMKSSPLSRNTGALGAFKLEMALKNTTSDSPYVEHEEEEEVTERIDAEESEGWLDRLRRRIFQPEAGAKFTREDTKTSPLGKAISHFFAGKRAAETMESRQVVRRGQTPPAEADSNAPQEILEEDPEGVLGQYNKYMAIQDYVQLGRGKRKHRSWRNLWLGEEADEPEKPSNPRPSRQRSRRQGSGRGFRLSLPSLGFILRFIWLLFPLALLGIFVHAYMMTDDKRQRTVTVIAVTGSVAEQDDANQRRSLQPGDQLDGATHPIISTGPGATAVLQMPGSRVKLAPASQFQIKRMGFNGGRIRLFDLKQGRIWTNVDPLHGKNSAFEVACQGVQVTVVGTKFSVMAMPDGAFISTLEGTVRVFTGMSKQLVPAGMQLYAQAGKVCGKAVPMSDAEKQLWQQQLVDLVPQGLVDAFTRSYEDTQDASLVPTIDGLLKLLKIKRVLPDSMPLYEDARALAKAQTALVAMSTLLMVNGEPPATLNLETVAELNLDDKERHTILDNFATGKVLYYKRSAKGDYDLLARANDSHYTMFRMSNGAVKQIPEEDEDKTLQELGLESKDGTPPGANGQNTPGTTPDTPGTTPDTQNGNPDRG